MAYVDGFLTPVPKKKLADYKRVSEKMGRILRELGALEFRECVADDVKWGKRTSFPRAVKQRAGETVLFSYVVFKSRAHRDRVNAKVIKEMEKMDQPPEMPFDMKRMGYGGFKTLVEG